MWIIKPRPKEWRPIPGYPNYEVSDVGHVRRVKPGRNTQAGRILKPVSFYEYLGYTLYRDGECRDIAEHILVCLAFHGPKPSPLHEVAHWDGKPWNNDYRNLRWATKKENYADKVRHGRARWHSPLHGAPATTDRLLRGQDGRYVPGHYGD